MSSINVLGTYLQFVLKTQVIYVTYNSSERQLCVFSPTTKTIYKMLRTHSVNEEKIDTLLSRGEIPIIDLAHSGIDERPSRSVINRVAMQLQKALTEKGIAFLVNHGISDDRLQKAWQFLDNFCELPTEVKEHYICNGSTNHGYTQHEEKATDFRKAPALRCAFNICTLNVFNLPDEPLPGFAEHITELATEFKALSLLLLQTLAIGLNLHINYFHENHSHMLADDNDNKTTLRLLYYPPVIEDDNKCELTKGRCKYSYQRCAMDCLDLGFGDMNASGADVDADELSAPKCGAHSDFGTFTLLSQDSEGGLEVRLPGSERFKRVGNLPGAILITAGEILGKWTESKYPAIEQRVVVPEQVHVRNKGRHSIAFFCHPDDCTTIAPIQMPSVEHEIKKPMRTSSFKVVKNKVTSAYQVLQNKFKKAS